jgi:zinc transport system substrate-binding protein
MQNNRLYYFCILGAIFIILFMTASSRAAESTTGKLGVYVVNYPLKYFAERIGVEHVKVVFPAPANVDPAYWMPEVDIIAAYQQADLILLNGAGYAKWINKVSLPRSKMINTSKKFRDQYIRSKVAVTHSHGPQGEHAHEDVSFTTWLDFRLAALQAEAIADTLIRKKPESRQFFEKNLGLLKRDLLALDFALREIVRKGPTQALLASHPVYDYLSRGYGLNLKSVHWEPDEMPNTEQWIELQKLLQKHAPKWMMWEGTPKKETVERLKSLGIKSLVYDPCGNAPQEGDFLQVMHQNIENLQQAFP